MRRFIDPEKPPEGMTVEEATDAGYMGTARLQGHPWRRYAAWGMGVLLVLIGLLTIVNANSDVNASAPQVIQAYAEGLFYATVIIGIGIAIYIGTRADE